MIDVMDIFARRWLTAASVVAGVVIGIAGGAREAAAHPHVFVTAGTTVQIENGTITGFEHTWTFDEFYSAMAVQDLAKAKDGSYTRETLQPLAKINIEGLKDFKYFTSATLGGQEQKLLEPADGTYWSEMKDGILSLHFKVLLEKPVLVDAKDFQFSIFDPSFFIAFDLAKTDPIKLSAGAPKTCKVALGEPKPEGDGAKKLGEAFFEQLGGANFGVSVAKSIRINC